ncbi:MAG: glycosyltransferase family 39 protein [Candidatus Aminicenantes bacterium]|nr:glycosyltransferase family 39 protein [Candidatus Aminicenantes bacterium]
MRRPGAAAVPLGLLVLGALLAAAGALTRPAELLLRMLPRRFSPFILGGELVPTHARVLGIYLGLALAVSGGLALLWRFLCRRPGFESLRTRRGKFLFVMIVVLALLTLSLAVNRIFWTDEIEHLHASWMVGQGRAPYRDFFEHHHPLLWFLLAPLVPFLGWGAAVLAASRLLMLLLAAGIAWLTWRIARLAGGGVEAGFLAVSLLFANFMFLPCVMEVRPDVPMVFLALAAVERLLVFREDGKPGRLLAAAFLAALSFLFLQKAAFLSPAAALLLVAWGRRGRIAPGLLLKAIAVFLLPLLLFLAWMLAAGVFSDYLLCNWLLNAGRRAAFSAWAGIGRLALFNVAFWLLLPWALPWALRPRQRPSAAVVALLGLSALLALCLLPNPADRHFLLCLPLLSVSVALFVSSRPFFRERRRWSAAVLAVLLLLPLPPLLNHPFPFNGVQLEKITFVLERTGPGERVLDGHCDFNLFRPDCHYFWFNVEEGGMLEDYRRLSGRSLEYDPCRLIRERRPQAALLSDREWRSCRLWRDYLPTPYGGLYLRDEGRRRAGAR